MNYVKIIGDIGQINNIKNIEMPIDIVVNAANCTLSIGSGVTGALVKSVGGPSKWAKLMTSAKNINNQSQLELKVGQTVYTSTIGQLSKDNVKYIIHALGPIADQQNISLIKTTIFNVLKMSDFLNAKNIVIPAISGGIFAGSDPNWPKQIRQLIIDEINNYMNNQPTKISKIYLISINETDQKLWPII